MAACRALGVRVMLTTAQGTVFAAHQGRGGHEGASPRRKRTVMSQRMAKGSQDPHRQAPVAQRQARRGDDGAEPAGDDRIALVPDAVEGSRTRCPRT